MSDTRNPTPYCDCGDHGVTGLDELVDLLNQGIDQRAASRMLWGGEAA